MFTVASGAAFAVLFAVWSRSGWLNTIVKVAFLAMAVWGGFDAMLAFGFVLAPQ